MHREVDASPQQEAAVLVEPLRNDRMLEDGGLRRAERGRWRERGTEVDVAVRAAGDVERGGDGRARGGTAAQHAPLPTQQLLASPHPA